MRIQDKLGLITAPRISQLRSMTGLPELAEVAFSHHSDNVAIYTLTPAPSSGAPVHDLSIEMVTPLQGSALHTELAVRKALQGVDAIPPVPTFRLVPPQVFGRLCAVTSHAGGLDGRGVLRADPTAHHLVAQTVGHVLRGLWEHPLLAFGGRGDDGRFVARRATWREEWGGHNAALGRALSASGHHLGALSRGLLAFVEQGLDALDGPIEPRLVHRGLRPGALRFEASPGQRRLVAVQGWSHAMAGDPLAEWGALAALPPTTLSIVLEAAGPDIRARIAQTDAVARIELYHATWVLERLREVFQSEAQVGDARASLKLEEIALFARKALDGETAKTLRAAASAPGATVAGSVNPPDPVRTALRAALSLMRADPPMSALESERFVVAAGGALAAGALGGATIQVGHAVVQRVLVTTARIGLALHADPIGDRASHGRTLVAHVLDRLGTAPTRCLSLAALALGLQGVAELGEATIDDAVLRGLEGHVRSVVARDLGGGPIADAGVRLAHVLLALSAVRWLEVQELADEARLTEMREELEEALLDAWERAEPMALPAVETVPKSEALVALVDARDQPPAVQLSRPALLHALATLHPDTRLPAAAAVLLVKAHL